MLHEVFDGRSMIGRADLQSRNVIAHILDAQIFTRGDRPPVSCRLVKAWHKPSIGVPERTPPNGEFFEFLRRICRLEIVHDTFDRVHLTGCNAIHEFNVFSVRWHNNHRDDDRNNRWRDEACDSSGWLLLTVGPAPQDQQSEKNGTYDHNPPVGVTDCRYVEYFSASHPYASGGILGVTISVVIAPAPKNALNPGCVGALISFRLASNIQALIYLREE
ncbi:MAG: hypothetical protein GC190_10835 [Alphaproteobacteria bacterium]|nr:hypothetical protein [Alphaproteobacteria bacterium]